ncbi:hypothetical protein D9619_004682 [Psilocybe cf. subviscida]|uniref:Uncharacterized protein n=1 Tax=Psilocybe cf. subviscida TaxID=2480587 RepID=A0A8H5F7N9_9AGAR|nr:hypothetical protein D9619_004682 [Psilocybe cf. subviscida]
MARMYLYYQIKSITKWFIKKAFASYLDNFGTQSAQESILKDTLCNTNGYSPVLQPVFGADWVSLHRHTVILALQIRNSLEENDKQFPIPAIIQHVAFRLPSLSTLLHHLDMTEEAGAIVNWAITVYKAIQFASPSAISPRLIYCLYSLSILCDTTGDKNGAYLAMDEALAVSKHLQATTWNAEVPVAVRVQYSEIMTGYASILARQKGDYTAAHYIAISAVKNMEDILDIPTSCSFHEVVDGYVQPTPSFLRHLGDKSRDSQQPIFVYAQALRVRAYFYGSENVIAGSLGDTLRAMIIFQHIRTTHGSVALPQLADTLYDIISHPNKSLLSSKQLLVYADASISIYHQRMKDNSTTFKCLLGALQIRAEILHNLGRDDEILETWRDYVNVAQTVLEGDEFANALLTVATNLRKLKMFSQSASIQTRSGPRVFEIMHHASMHAQAKWHFNLFLDFFSAGRFAEAVRAAGRSVEKYRELERTDPGAWLASLARGLSALALCLSFTGDHSNALLNCTEAIEIFKQHPDQARVEKMYRRACEISALVSGGKRRKSTIGLK